MPESKVGPVHHILTFVAVLTLVTVTLFVVALLDWIPFSSGHAKFFFMEVNIQIINVIFTIQCIYQHPVAIWLTYCTFRYRNSLKKYSKLTPASGKLLETKTMNEIMLYRSILHDSFPPSGINLALPNNPQPELLPQLLDSSMTSITINSIHRLTHLSVDTKHEDPPAQDQAVTPIWKIYVALILWNLQCMAQYPYTIETLCWARIPEQRPLYINKYLFPINCVIHTVSWLWVISIVHRHRQDQKLFDKCVTKKCAEGSLA